MQIVTSFVTQLNGTIEIRHHNPGTEFVVILPLSDHVSFAD